MFLLLFLTLLPAALFSQEGEIQELPSWIVLEKGKRAYRQGELGLALYYFQETLKKQDLTADALTWIGKIHEAEGEYLLAEDAYKRAIEHERFFYVWEERFEPRRLLASVLAKTAEDEDSIEDSIAAYDELIAMAGGDEGALFEPSFLLEQFYEKGFDKFFELYRPKSSKTLLARVEKAALLQQLGRKQEALENYLMAIAIPSSMVIELLMEKNPAYQFISLPTGYRNTLEMLLKAEREPSSSAFLKEAKFYESLYHFASLLRQEDEEGLAKESFLILSNLQGEMRWRRLAAESLAPRQ
jgi:tetratricopeptide (TPR) repeat protein